MRRSRWPEGPGRGPILDTCIKTIYLDGDGLMDLLSILYERSKPLPMAGRRRAGSREVSR